MTAPERPSPGEVEAALAFAEEHHTMVAAVLAAEVRALRAQLGRTERHLQAWVDGFSETVRAARAEIARLQDALDRVDPS